MSDIETIKALQAENARLISLVKEIEDALIASKAAADKAEQKLSALFDKIETNEDGWARLGQKAYAAFFTYEEVASLQSLADLWRLSDRR